MSFKCRLKFDTYWHWKMWYNWWCCNLTGCCHCQAAAVFPPSEIPNYGESSMRHSLCHH